MQLPTWGTRHPWLLGIGACVLLGVAAGWVFNGPPSATGLRQDGDAWNLPDRSVLTRYHAADFQALVRSQAWQEPRGAQIAGGPAGMVPGAWKLVGIITSPEFQALVLPQGGKTQRLSVGDKLPNGSRIEKIDHDWVEYTYENCLQRRILFPRPGGVVVRSKSCKPQAGADRPGAPAGETHE